MEKWQDRQETDLKGQGVMGQPPEGMCSKQEHNPVGNWYKVSSEVTSKLSKAWAGWPWSIETTRQSILFKAQQLQESNG